MTKNFDKKKMLPPKPNYCCRKCKKPGYLSEWEKIKVEYGKEIKCPDCGGELKVYLVVEKK